MLYLTPTPDLLDARLNQFKTATSLTVSTRLDQHYLHAEISLLNPAQAVVERLTVLVDYEAALTQLLLEYDYLDRHELAGFRARLAA